MEDYSIRRQMYHDLIEAYKKVAPHCWTQLEAYERTVKEPAPRYYVTAKQAHQVIAHMIKGDFGKVNKMLPLRRKMYYALFDEFVSLCEKPTFYNKSAWFIIHHAVIRPAPEFFISAGRIRHLRSWLKRGIIDNEGKIDDFKSRVNINSPRLRGDDSRRSRRRLFYSKRLANLNKARLNAVKPPNDASLRKPRQYSAFGGEILRAPQTAPLRSRFERILNRASAPTSADLEVSP